MLTWTHALAAWPIGRSLKGGDDNFVPLACVCGAIVPDLSLITQIFINWGHGRRGEDYISPLSDLLTQITHSIPVWTLAGIMLFMLCGFLQARESTMSRLLGFFAGVFVAHIGIDLLTHKSIPIPGADYLWPWHYRLGPILGIWNYRLSLNNFLPRWQEAVIDVGLVSLIAWMEFFSPSSTRQKYLYKVVDIKIAAVR